MLFAVVLLMTASAAAQRPSDPPAKAFGNTSTSYRPITGPQRLNWAVKSTIGPVSLAAGLFSAGFGTAMGRPREYGPHWEGFGKRYGMRFHWHRHRQPHGGVGGRLVGRRPKVLPSHRTTDQGDQERNGDDF